MNSAQTLPSQLRSVLILSSHLSPCHPSRLFPSDFLGKNRVCSCLRCDTCYIVCQSHCVRFGRSNNIWRSVQITILLILKIYPPPSCFVTFRFGCFPQHFFFLAPLNCVLPLILETKFYHHHHHKRQGLDPLIRSVSKVTTILSNVSSVFQLFYFLVVSSSIISKGFGFVAFFCKCWNQFRLYSSILSSMPVICSSRRM